MNNPVNRFMRALSLAGFVMANLGVIGMVEAAEEVRPALSYDQAGERLFKIDSNRLFQNSHGSKRWEDVSLPDGAKDGRLVTAVVPATAEETLYIAGPTIGVQRSVDNGKTWQTLNENLPSQNVIAFTVHRNQAETLYAVIADDGLYQSEDAGETWKQMDSGPTQTIRRLVHSDMEGSMQTGWLYAVSDDALRLSMDCFCGWRLAGELDAGKVYDIAYDTNEPKRVFVITEQGLFRSDNGGQEWQGVKGDSPKLVALAHSPAGTLYGLDIEGNLMSSADQGQTWMPSGE